MGSTSRSEIVFREDRFCFLSSVRDDFFLLFRSVAGWTTFGREEGRDGGLRDRDLPMATKEEEDLNPGLLVKDKQNVTL